MKHVQFQYPNISDIFAQKASGRRARAKLTFAEKLVLLDLLRERAEPFVQARQQRKARQTFSYSSETKQF